MKKPLQIESEVPEHYPHRMGKNVIREIEEAIYKAFEITGCHVDTSSVYHDYLAIKVGRLNPRKADGETVLQAVRRVIPKWRRVTVSVHEEKNCLSVLCYAHDIITA